MPLILAMSSSPGTDAALADTRDRLLAQGVPVAGVLQSRAPWVRGGKDQMVLHDAAHRFSRVISQDLGAGADGCSLDPGSLEEVAQQVGQTLPGARVLFVNRFGKQEETGRGFAPLIARALEQGSHVVIAVAAEKRAAFIGYAGEMAQWTTPEALTDALQLHLAGEIPG
ncbi:DUF2478 domain-containing protein [Lutimaribacter sp. EGI FJ00014]|uniref:DUF2478 domain-containing protein n=1 Tax=Lutimaribacter degradans TaxID=2945989 RepID=A0ACC5ZXJ7_9RHOB|nr:DUF2478 domain-containing protein [Lutimaribacter sp. EGI FJ00013]MCM2562094.1 DUF2478 domain-containing protein [Lutimaribacter sp. EGI FJ00013]MCO0636224.1 DUF2478 domain-containing protein [Lutimaribacter sp. EGI FJ00014]